MSDTTENLSDICARIRKIDESMMRDLDFMAVFLKYLPRDIEAAAERERASLEDALVHCRQYAQKIERENEEGETRLDAEEIIATVDNEFAGIRPEHAPGDAASLREALMKAKLYFDHRGEGTNLDDAGMAIDAITSIDADLAAPARNCDRPFRSADEAIGVYVTERGDGPHLGYCDAIKWALAPAKGGDHA